MQEFAAADFKHPGKRLNRTKKQVKSCYDSNNARNRDIYSITKSNDMLKEEKDITHKNVPTRDQIEDAVIQIIDLKAKIKRNQES